MKRIIFFAFLCAYSIVSIHASALDLEKIRNDINESGAAWVAEENPLTRLGAEERKRLIGALDDPKSSLRKLDSITLDSDDSLSLNSLPAFLDWRNLDGKNWISPVRDQNPYGSCTAFAAIACLESLLKIQSADPGLDLDLSERFLFAYGGGQGYLGWWVTQAADFLLTVGVVSESACPYGEWDGAPPDDSAQIYLDANTTFQIEDWNEVFYLYIPNAENENKVKNALVNAPIVALMDVYEDFVSYSSGVYEKVSGGFIGPHAVLLIGWDDAQDCWICKNSWGESWGESGFFRIKKSNMGKSNFPKYALRFHPRTSPDMRYYFGSGVPSFVPDPGSFSSNCDVRGSISATDITFQVSLVHDRMEDIACRLTSPLGASSIMMYRQPASSVHLTEFFLNDNAAFSLSDLVSARDSSGFVNYRGCARPDNPLSPLLYSWPYGFWNLTVSDEVSGVQGVLKNWGVYFAAYRATSSQPDLWNRY